MRLILFLYIFIVGCGKPLAAPVVVDQVAIDKINEMYAIMVSREQKIDKQELHDKHCKEVNTSYYKKRDECWQLYAEKYETVGAGTDDEHTLDVNKENRKTCIDSTEQYRDSDCD